MAGDVAHLLRQRGLRVTGQRLAVLRAVSDVPHVTADVVAESVRSELGAISLQGVYDALGALVDVARGGEQSNRVQPQGPPAELSRGEIELLSLLPGRETNGDIAEQLGVSLNTVKTMLQRLYRKLGVAGRNEAVTVARSRNLLPRQASRISRGE